MKTQMDPAYVREFASFLSGISQEISRLNSGIANDWQELSMNGWDDQLAAKFGRVLDESINSVGTFADQSQTYCELLMQKADHIERYLDR